MNYINREDTALNIAIQVLENRLEELEDKYPNIYDAEPKYVDEFLAIQDSIDGLRKLSGILTQLGTDLP